MEAYTQHVTMQAVPIADYQAKTVNCLQHYFDGNVK
jgi:hypothetical protein